MLLWLKAFTKLRYKVCLLSNQGLACVQPPPPLPFSVFSEGRGRLYTGYQGVSKLNVGSVPTFSISFLPTSSYAGVEEGENDHGKLLRKIKQFSTLLVLFNKMLTMVPKYVWAELFAAGLR